MLPVSKPAPRDPAPSRLRYRLQRWWLTPHVRWTARRGLPFVILLLGGAYVVTMPSVQEAAKRTLSDVRSHVAARPELQVTQMRMAGVPDQLRGPVDAAVGVSLPISTLDLKPLEIKARIEALPRAKVLLCLGKISHDSTVRTLGLKLKDHPFGHGTEYKVGDMTLLSSYHCSRYNTNTGRLTEAMFDTVFERARAIIQA